MSSVGRRNLIDGSTAAALVLMILICWSLTTTRADGSACRTALEQSLLFFEAQRSGWMTPNNRVTWRQNSALNDGFPSGLDLVGGYYDAGDHVKFGFPMAYGMTMISWGAIEFKNEMTAVNKMNMLEAIRWGTDYLIKCHRQPYFLWCKVGDGNTDHFCWQRPEDMTTPRTTYSVDAQNPGSDVAAETTVGLALASILLLLLNCSFLSFCYGN